MSRPEAWSLEGLEWATHQEGQATEARGLSVWTSEQDGQGGSDKRPRSGPAGSR